MGDYQEQHSEEHIYEQALIGGMVYLDRRFIRADIYLDGEVISHIEIDPTSVHPTGTVHDCSGFHIMPGLIDPHVHMALEVGGHKSADDFRSGSQAALYGGITTILDFLDPITGAHELEKSFSMRKRLANGQGCHCDYGFHATLGNFKGDCDALIEEVMRLKLYGIKVFTAYSESDRMIGKEVLKQLLDRPVLTMVHAEMDSMVESSASDISTFGDSRPLISELAELEELLEMVGEQGELYVVHVSSGSGVRMLSGRRNVHVETCPHYLYFNDEALGLEGGGRFLMAPPLRNRKEMELLRECMRTPGEIDTIGTDHCPFMLSEKTTSDDASRIPKGVGGIGLSFLLAYRLIGFDAIHMMSERVADIFGIPQKGRICVGCDADFAIFDPEGETPPYNTFTNCDYSIYEDLGILRGQFVGTMVRGGWGFRRVGESGGLKRDGRIIFNEPRGKYCVPASLLTDVTAYDYRILRENTYILFDERVRSVGSMSTLHDEVGILSLESLSKESAKGRMLLPGLIDFHTHLYSSLVCGFDFNRSPESFRELLEDVWWRLDRNMRLDDVELSTRHGLEKCISHGVTGIFDHHAGGAITGSMEVIDDIMDEMGMTGCTCFETSDRYEVKTCIDENIDHIRKCNGGFFGLHAPMTLSDITLTSVLSALEMTTNGRFHIHVAESSEDQDAVQRLERNGLLGLGSTHAVDSLLAHCVHISEADAEIIGKSGAVVVVNPRSNLNNGVGSFNYRLLKEKRIPVLVGTDGYGADVARSWQDFYLTAKESLDGRMDLDEIKKIVAWSYLYFSRITNRDTGRFETGVWFDAILVPYAPRTPMNRDNVFAHVLFEVFEALRPEKVLVGGIDRLGRLVLTDKELNDIHEKVKLLWDRIDNDNG